MTQRIGYRGGDRHDVTLTFVLPPEGRKLAGPWHLENGWLQILGGNAELEDFLSHHWEDTTNLSDPGGWSPMGDSFISATDGTLLTLTNGAAYPRRLFRLAMP